MEEKERNEKEKMVFSSGGCGDSAAPVHGVHAG